MSFSNFRPHHQLTPAMRQVLDRMARAGRPPIHAMAPDQARKAYALGAEVLDIPKQALARVEDLQIPAADGHALPARLYAPETVVLPTLVYFHGGGFMVGNVETHDALCRSLSHRSGCAVISVDYRLAPEYRFPTAADDAWSALYWLQRQSQSLGLSSDRWAVGGDSAGGTLAAATAIQARNEGLPLALQLLFYPGCSAFQDRQSHHTYAHGFVLERSHITWFFDHYVRSDADRQDWRFAPLMADDLSGVAPAWIGLAECDPLVDEGLEFADRLRMAGVHVELEIYRGVVHEFIKMGRAIPEALLAHDHAAQAIRHALMVPQ